MKYENIKTISDVKFFNKQQERYFFSKDTMRFFNSKIESVLLEDNHFITSERMELSHPKKYSIRKLQKDGSIETIGEFCQFKTKQEAKDFIKNL